jgi:putative FmdB family regulatory protein
MPIYEYRCRNGHQFEVFQAISDEPVTACQECGEPVERVFHPIAVHFKGSGFYTTDYARKTSGKAAESTDGKQSKDAGSDSKPESSDSKPESSDSKPEKKTEGASSSSKDE